MDSDRFPSKRTQHRKTHDPDIHPKEQRTRVLSTTTVSYTNEDADTPKFV
jgi:hypothetical protein